MRHHIPLFRGSRRRSDADTDTDWDDFATGDFESGEDADI
ncbi:hypothetical protein GCM10009806_08170 [Microbacterium flavum]